MYVFVCLHMPLSQVMNKYIFQVLIKKESEWVSDEKSPIAENCKKKQNENNISIFMWNMKFYEKNCGEIFANIY